MCPPPSPRLGSENLAIGRSQIRKGLEPVGPVGPNCCPALYVLAAGHHQGGGICSGASPGSRVEFDAGDLTAAEAHCEEVLSLTGEMHSLQWAPVSWRLLARLALVNGQPERCLRLLAAAAALQKRTGRIMDSVTEREVTHAQDAARQLIGEEAQMHYGAREHNGRLQTWCAMASKTHFRFSGSTSEPSESA